MPDNEKGRMLTGARARFYLDGVPVGYANSVTIDESVNYEPVEILGQLHDEEHVPTSYKVNLSAEMFRVVGKTLKSDGFFPSTDQDATTHLLNVLTTKGLTATVEDRVTGQTIARLEQVKIASHNWTIDRTSITGERVEFVAIRAFDEYDK
jgi:hypothetical protein